MTTFRQQRVGEIVHLCLANHMPELRDRRIQGVVITDVRMSRDLHIADVYYALMVNHRFPLREVKRALSGAAGAIRRMVAMHAKLKYCPELRFFYDETLERSRRIEALLESLSENHDQDEEALEDSQGRRGSNQKDRESG